MPSRLTRRSVVCGALTTVSATSLAGFLESSGAMPPEDPVAGRNLVFEDDFTVLDGSVWQAGPKATTFDPGFYGRGAFARIAGEEGFNPYAIVDDAAASNGKALSITMKYMGRAMKVPNYYGNHNREFQWITGNIQTAKPDGTIIKGWRRGFFEARMRFPNHPLSWPGFWLMNARSILHPKTSVEIDIVEHKGWERQLYGCYLHEWGKPGERHEGTSVPVSADLTGGYHRYAMLVDGDLCMPYFDRKPVRHTATGQPIAWRIARSAELDATNDVFWPLLSLALHADVPFPDPLLPEHRTAEMRVDYFHVYV
jgi:beta-glucanase (GH16 family)